MKRNTFLATLGALSMLALPAMAQNDNDGDRDHRRHRPDRGDVDFDGEFRRPAAMPSVSSYAPRSVGPGETVTIHGANFVPGIRVLLDGEVIAPSSVEVDHIYFKVPAGVEGGELSLILPGRRRALAVGTLDIAAPARRPGRRFEDDDGWSRSRWSRRAKSRERIFGRWNHRFLDSAAARAELRVHARRMARLQRMKRIARRSGRTHLVVRINAAMRREDARHEREMKALARDFGRLGHRRF